MPYQTNKRTCIRYKYSFTKQTTKKRNMKILKIILQARKNFYTWVNNQPCTTIKNGGLI